MRLAYLTGRYPAITHTFILREIRALHRVGIDVERFSVWRTAERDLLSSADVKEWQQTDALLPPRPARFLRAHFRAALRAPQGYIATLRRALALSMPTIRRRALAVLWFTEAIMLWDLCRERGVTHVHAHLDGTAPMVALLAIEFANAEPASGEVWSWSQTVHGSKEFYDVHRERFAQRALRASFTVCVSDYTRSQVMAFVPEELWGKLAVVRCGVDVHEFVPRTTRRQGDPRILTVGRVDSMKGTVVLLHALAQLAQRGLHPVLTVVGDGPSKTKAISIANRLGVGHQVTWEGAVGQDAIRDFYADCDVFCLPSFSEGVPIVLMEAMAMEIPVVASAITGIVELVENEVNGLLVRPGRLDQLTDSLARLLQDPTMRDSMGRAGRQKVTAEYDLDRNVREFARLFRDGHPRVDHGMPGLLGASVEEAEAH
jgi:colanic acid/amylovoran biosynthesis glycosyltransferase